MGLKDSFSKGITTINLKTSNFMDETKYKTGITTKENEIAALKAAIGQKVFENRKAFSMDMIAEEIKGIEERIAAIEALQSQINALAEKEKDILGKQSAPQSQMAMPGEIKYCADCGAPNKIGFKFCEKCGKPLQ